MPGKQLITATLAQNVLIAFKCRSSLHILGEPRKGLSCLHGTYSDNLQLLLRAKRPQLLQPCLIEGNWTLMCCCGNNQYNCFPQPQLDPIAHTVDFHLLYMGIIVWVSY